MKFLILGLSPHSLLMIVFSSINLTVGIFMLVIGIYNIFFSYFGYEIDNSLFKDYIVTGLYLIFVSFFVFVLYEIHSPLSFITGFSLVYISFAFTSNKCVKISSFLNENIIQLNYEDLNSNVRNKEVCLMFILICYHIFFFI